MRHSSGGNVPYVLVNADDGADFSAKFTQYALNNIPIFVPKGTYICPRLVIPHSTASRTIHIIGSGSEGTTIISDGSVGGTLGFLDSEQTSWENTTVILENINFKGGGTERWILHLPFCKVNIIGKVKVNGDCKNSGDRWFIEQGGSGSGGVASHIDALSIEADGAYNPTGLFKWWDEALAVGSLSLVCSNRQCTTALNLAGTAYTFDYINCYIGDGKTITTLINIDTAQVNIGTLYANNSSTGVITNLIAQNAGSLCNIGLLQNDAATPFNNFLDATTQALTNVGAYRNTPLFKIFTAVTDGATKAHNLGLTPSGCIASGTIAGEMIGVTALDDTNVTFSIKTHAGASGTSQTVYCLFKI